MEQASEQARERQRAYLENHGSEHILHVVLAHPSQKGCDVKALQLEPGLCRAPRSLPLPRPVGKICDRRPKDRHLVVSIDLVDLESHLNDLVLEPAQTQLS